MAFMHGPHLALLHPPKGAGTWIGQVLESVGLATLVGLTRDPRWRSHLTAREAAAAGWLAGRIVVAPVRPPGHWYCSWVAHMRLPCGAPGRALDGVAAAMGSDTTDALVRGLVDPGAYGVPAAGYLPLRGKPEPWGRDCAGRGYGLWSWMLEEHLRGDDGRTCVTYLLDAARPREALAALLALLDEDPAPAWAHPAANTNAEHGGGQTWSGDPSAELEPETLALIAERDPLPEWLAGVGWMPERPGWLGCSFP